MHNVWKMARKQLAQVLGDSMTPAHIDARPEILTKHGGEPPESEEESRVLSRPHGDRGSHAPPVHKVSSC